MKVLNRCLTQESARSIIEKLVRSFFWKVKKVIAFQVERGAQLSKKNLANKTPLDLMFECIQSPGEFISSLWSKRVSWTALQSHFYHS